MTTILQIFLAVFCIVLLYLIVTQINKSRVIFSDFNYWLIFIIFLLSMAIFPELAYWLADLLGVQTPVIGIFLIVIGLLILLSLSLALRISVLNRRFIQLTQKIAIVEEETNNKIKKIMESKE
ncbi:MAG TPA: DUF2304 domain-containing protein [Firmicutes bacterium]|nr:DUF2304 domain-containing protein [Bacillota bacterium]